MRIESSFQGQTVITEIEMLSGDLNDTAQLLLDCLDILRQQKGFCSAALHRCVDEARWLLYAQWDSWEDWNASLFSTRWAQGPASRLWEDVSQGRLRLQPTVYEVTATY